MKNKRSSGGHDIRVLGNSSMNEKERRHHFFDQFMNCPIPPEELMMNLGLFMNRQALSRILFMHELYKLSLHIHGVVMEFGVRWGQNLALFENFRGIYEPYNYNRLILGFDTFSGFAEVAPQDGKQVKRGDYSVSENYDTYLAGILEYHESESPIAHIRKFELIKGDACATLKAYLQSHPETIVALVYFDFDLYKPTKECLELIRPHLTKGSIIGFDELNVNAFPGETLALKETLGLNRCRINRLPLSPLQSWIVFE